MIKNRKAAKGPHLSWLTRPTTHYQTLGYPTAPFRHRNAWQLKRRHKQLGSYTLAPNGCESRNSLKKKMAEPKKQKKKTHHQQSFSWWHRSWGFLLHQSSCYFVLSVHNAWFSPPSWWLFILCHRLTGALKHLPYFLSVIQRLVCI